MASLPVRGFAVNQGFGENPASYSQFGLAGHEGWDFPTPIGTPVYAAKSGTIGVIASNYGGYGNCIIIKTYQGEGIICGHLFSFGSSYYGKPVLEGELIGYTGNSGNSTGPHFHFGYQPAFLQNLNNGYWGCVNPGVLFNQGGAMAQDYISQINDLNAQKGALQAQVEGERAKNVQLATQVTNLVTQLTQTQIQVEQLRAGGSGPISKEQVIAYLTQNLK